MKHIKIYESFEIPGTKSLVEEPVKEIILENYFHDGELMFESLLADIKKLAKQGALTASLISALVASPMLSSAQKQVLQDYVPYAQRSMDNLKPSTGSDLDRHGDRLKVGGGEISDNKGNYVSFINKGNVKRPFDGFVKGEQLLVAEGGDTTKAVKVRGLLKDNIKNGFRFDVVAVTNNPKYAAAQIELLMREMQVGEDFILMSREMEERGEGGVAIYEIKVYGLKPSVKLTESKTTDLIGDIFWKSAEIFSEDGKKGIRRKKNEGDFSRTGL